MANDPAHVDGSHYSVELENDHVRVLRVKYGPGEKSEMHWHPKHIAISLTDASLKMHFPDGSSEDLIMKAGEIVEAPAGDHQPENIADASMEAILVEFKGAA